MNATTCPRSHRWFKLFAVSLCSLPLLAASANGADAGMPFLQANVVYEFASDRAHMIQISVVFVAIGCAIMWWYR
jgi:hypothetical protein